MTFGLFLKVIFYSELSCQSRVLSVVTEPLQMRLLKGEEMNSVLRRRLRVQEPIVIAI